MKTESFDDNSLWSRRQVAHFWGVSPSTIDRYVRQGVIAGPIIIGPGRNGFVPEEQRAVRAARILERDQKLRPAREA